MAVNENVITQNPFNFKLDIIKDDRHERCALTDAQVKELLTFMEQSRCYRKHLDTVNILLNTGLRVGEFCGLTKRDIDMKNKTIDVTHQLIVNSHGVFRITPPKTKKGIRKIPMNTKTYLSFKHILETRDSPKIEIMIDGYSGFLQFNKAGKPLYPYGIQTAINRLWKAYNRTHEPPLPQITPHIFRHTFCTNML